MFNVAGAVAIVALLICGGVADATTVDAPDDDVDPFSNLRELGIIKGSIQELTWSPDDEDLFSVLESAGLPAIIKGATVVQNWKAMTDWSFDLLKSKVVHQLRNIRRSNTGYFQYFNDLRSGTYADVPAVAEAYKAKAYELVHMDKDEFFNLLDEPNSELGFNYYGDNLETLGDDAYDDVYPLTPLIVKNESYDESQAHLFRRTQVWIGPGGAVTHCHYDESWNLFVQLVGRKRFLFFPPSNWTGLYMYPFLHPGAKQSQLDLRAPDLEAFPDFKHVYALEADVRRGDVLYIPPTWAHHVVSMENAISVNVWSPAHQHIVNVALDIELPFVEKYAAGTVKRALAARLYLSKLIDAVLRQQESAAAFIGELYNKRFGRLVAEHSETLLSCKKSYCVDSLSLMSEDEFDDHWAGWDEDREWEHVSAADLAAEDNKMWTVSILDVADIFHQVPDEGERNVWLRNYVEVYVMRSIGNVGELACFLRDAASC